MATNVVPEGSLRNHRIRAELGADCSFVRVKPVMVQIIDHLTLEFSKWFPTEMFPADLIATKDKTLVTPLMVTIEPNIDLPVYTREEGTVKNSLGSLDVSLTIDNERHQELHRISLPKMTLKIAEIVGPFLLLASRDPKALGTEYAAITDTRNSGADPAGKLYFKWERTDDGDLLVNSALLVYHSDGVVWRIVQRSNVAGNENWQLDAVTVYLTNEELAGPAVSVSDMRLTQTIEGVEVRMPIHVSTVLSGDCAPFDPSSAVRVINEGFALSALAGSPATVGDDWTLHLTGRAGQRTLDEKLTKATVASQKLMKQQGGVPFLVHHSGGVQWWGGKRTDKSVDFALLWVIVNGVRHG